MKQPGGAAVIQEFRQARQEGDSLEDHLKEIEMKDTNVRRV